MDKILIVGAGPTGLMLATCLERLGIPFRIIDQKPGPSKHSKALGLQPRTLEILNNLGLADQFLSKGNPIHAFNWYNEGKKILHIDLDKNLESTFKNILILPQSETEELLIENLKQKVEWNTPFTNFAEADWIMGCDGAHSQVRKEMGCTFKGDAIAHYFLLADVKAKWPFSQQELQIFFQKEGVMALFPINPKEGLMRIVANLPQTKEERAFTQQEIQALFENRSGLSVPIDELIWTSLFKVSYHIANKVQEGKVFLLGDAFHIHSPVGGQGMNTGMQDAYNLAWKLAMVIKGQAPASLLKTYTDERLSNAQNLINVTRQATKMVDNPNAFVRFLRRSILPYVIPYFQRPLANTIGQLRLRYSKNSILQDDGPGLKEKVGMRFPASPLSQKFHLFLYGEDPAFEQISTLAKEKIDAEIHLNGGKEGALYLVRPDGVIGYRASPIKLESFEKYLKGLTLPKKEEEKNFY